MRRWLGPCGHRCWGVPVLRLDGAPFGGPVLTLERANLQQLLVVINLILCIQPALANDMIICLEDVDERCRRSRCATDNSVKKLDFVGGECGEFGYRESRGA
jgi:hypothetical protein